MRRMVVILRSSLLVSMSIVFALSSAPGRAAEAEKTPTEEAMMETALQIQAIWPPKDMNGCQFHTMLMAALKAARVETLPKEKIKAIREELNALVGRFTNNKELRTDTYMATAQVLVYFYLTKPELSEKDTALLKSQRERFLGFMDKLPERMIAEFHAPAALKKETEDALAVARKDLEEIVTSDFYRFAQTPMPEERFLKFMDDLASGTLRLGNQTAQQFDHRGSLASIRLEKTPWAGDPKRVERMKQSELIWALNDIRAVSVLLHGRAAGIFVHAYVHSDWSMFPFGGRKGYGTLYRRAGKGILFRITPETKPLQ